MRTLGIIAIAAMSACGGGSGGGGGSFPVGTGTTPTTGTTTTAGPTNVAEAIKVAETNKSIPTLNRDATVVGPDVDGNGVRDDIDAYIAGLNDTDQQKASLRQTSSAMTAAMQTTTSDKQALLDASKRLSNSASCLTARYGSLAAKKGGVIEKLTVNTKTRFDAYMAFNAAVSGTTSLSPQGDGCAN